MSAILTDTAADFETLILDAEKLCERRNPRAHQVIGMAKQEAIPGDAKQAVMLQYIEAFADCFINNNYNAAVKRLKHVLHDIDEDVYAAVGYKLLMTLGNAYQSKGDIFSAQERYLQGMKLLSAKDELTNKEKLFSGAFYYNLATMLASTDLELESAGYLEKAIAIYKQVGNKFKLAHCYVAYAQLQEQKHDLVKASAYLSKALLLGREINDAYIIALSLANTGVICVKENKPQNALSHFRTALQYYQTNGMLAEMAVVNLKIAECYLTVQRVKISIDHLNQAERIMQQLDNKKELSDIYRTKADALVQAGMHKEAVVYFQKYIETLKFYYDQEKTESLTRAKLEFETSQREKEARLLHDKNREIQQYARKLEISNNELKQFASVASHDLKEPLRVISGCVYLLQKNLGEAASEHQLDLCNHAVTGAKRMEQMIQDLLRLARVDTDPRLEKVDLNRLIDELKLNLRTLIKEHNAEIQAQALPAVYADRAQMLHLFQNLIANGINYNNTGAPLITITTFLTDNNLVIEVGDNGSGIPQNYRETVFEIFKTIPGQTTGSGIGLAICKKIVDKMEGTIEILDNTGGGTIFRMTFGKSFLSV